MSLDGVFTNVRPKRGHFMKVEAFIEKPYPGGGYTIETEESFLPFGRIEWIKTGRAAKGLAVLRVRKLFALGKYREVVAWRCTTLQGTHVFSLPAPGRAAVSGGTNTDAPEAPPE